VLVAANDQPAPHADGGQPHGIRRIVGELVFEPAHIIANQL